MILKHVLILVAFLIKKSFLKQLKIHLLGSGSFDDSKYMC